MLFNALFPLAVASLCSQVVAQTWSTCNPLKQSGCPANTALGKSIAVDFTKGSVNSFTASGNPTYDSNGASFTVAKSGDAPQLNSVFYIMFGKVELTMKAAPGAGIVSTLVLISDDLDEIDMEWLGADGTEVQTNYFGKGDVTTYNRGQFNPAPNNQGEFITYTIEWTESQITWKVGNTIVRVLTPATADTNQYPQSPMQVRFGSWAGGDAANNAPGTVEWARGPTNYANGPFTMVVKSLSVTDYSTGSEYVYGDQTGNWGSIKAVGGAINGNAGGKAATVASADVPAATSASPSIPAGIGSTNGDTATKTGWPWVASTTLATSVASTPTSTAGIPSGWIITSTGKVVPASTAASPPTTLLSVLPSPSSALPIGAPGFETIVGWNDQGFPTTYVRPAGWSTLPKSYDDQGFLVTSQPAPTPTPTVLAAAVAQSVAPVVMYQKAASSTTESAAPRQAQLSLLPVALGSAIVVLLYKFL